MILFRKRLDDFPRLSSTLIHKTIHHLGGVDKIRRAVLDEVNLGSMSWDRLKIYLLDSPVAEYESVEGLTGISALGFTSIQLDFRSQRFSWAD